MKTCSSLHSMHARPAKTIAWLDDLLDTLHVRFHASLVSQTAGEVARECHHAVWRHVLARCGHMNAAQARGYVRAIASSFIVGEVDAVLCRRRTSFSLRGRVVAEAREQLVELIVDDLSCAQLRQTRPFRLVAA